MAPAPRRAGLASTMVRPPDRRCLDSLPSNRSEVISRRDELEADLGRASIEMTLDEPFDMIAWSCLCIAFHALADDCLRASATSAAPPV